MLEEQRIRDVALLPSSMLPRRQVAHTRIAAQSVDSVVRHRPPPPSLGDLPPKLGGGGGSDGSPSFPWLAKRGSSALDEAKRRELELRVTPSADEAKRLFELGNSLGRQSRWFEACDAYRDAETHNIHSVEIKRNRGIALCEVGNYVEAQAVLMAANQLSANSDPKVKLVLGSALIELGRIDEAVSELTMCVALAPTDAVAQRTLGMALHQVWLPIMLWCDCLAVWG